MQFTDTKPTFLKLHYIYRDLYILFETNLQVISNNIYFESDYLNLDYGFLFPLDDTSELACFCLIANTRFYSSSYEFDNMSLKSLLHKTATDMSIK